MLLPTGAPTDKNDSPAMSALVHQTLDDLHRAENVERALTETGYGQLRGIQVTVHAGLLILNGHVRSYYLKQLAQAIALSATGTDSLRNDIQVGCANPAHGAADAIDSGGRRRRRHLPQHG